MNERLPYLVGLDLGGSSVKAVATTPEGMMLEELHETFDANAHLHFAETVRVVYQRIVEHQARPPASVGLSAPGLAADDGRSIAIMPGRLQGLERLDWASHLGHAHGIPVLNDAHAALLGEVWRGAARGQRQVILLTLGTGVGGAAMVDGQLLRGAIGRAGHLGHTSLDPEGPSDVANTPGSLEYAIGNYTIRERSGGRFRTTHDLIAAYRQSNPHALRVWLKSVRALAAAICSFLNILDPEVVILGGGIARAGDALFEPLAGFVDEMEWRPGGHRVRIVPAELGEHASAYGAAFHAGRQAGLL